MLKCDLTYNNYGEHYNCPHTNCYGNYELEQCYQVWYELYCTIHAQYNRNLCNDGNLTVLLKFYSFCNVSFLYP